ncbi:type I restriction endonuclease subunit R [Microscilla marina]|nr:type I restriction endonuclease [Microscilla marina]
MTFNEDTRVKIPAILHLISLGYEYLSLKAHTWDKSTNIFRDIFDKSIRQINRKMTDADLQQLYDKIALSLENEELGRAFYQMLVDQSGTRLIDFDNFDNNSFHVVTELPYENKDENFRPDIILLINGMPLVFIEVKKPNNKNGIAAEHKRMERRNANKKFRKFMNLTQLMLYTNNMEYQEGSLVVLAGSYYASSSYGKPVFNYFREEETHHLGRLLRPVSSATEDLVLQDNNLTTIKGTPEFATNKQPDTPTNRICTSLLQRNRLAFILRYAIAYVKESHGLEKHVMRYPQMFASKAIETKLEAGIRKGIIWHTQGSGKTALAYYNVKFLTDYFRAKNKVAKFYFIVDRLDLLKQAKGEFEKRGLRVHEVSSRDEFAQTIKSASAIHNNEGKPEITVVNIHKFKDDPQVARSNDYAVDIQRVYFLDEVHRSYNPKGSFLANLNQSDPNAIKIGLTGTPLLGTDKTYDSKSVFGDYIHKYYYNASIADGYTLRLIREEIETSYKLQLQEILNELKRTLVYKGSLNKKDIYAHPQFVEPLLEYIIKDIEQARATHGDPTIGAMVVCDSSEQARQLMKTFEEGNTGILTMVAEDAEVYKISEATQKRKDARKVKTAALILHDEGDKQTRKDQVEDFKDGKIDVLFVYNMLLTGFDAKRLKKLYLTRVIRTHNLLQTLTRVNRTYKDFRYGYVVDFADIQSEFDKTNRAYFDELQNELGDEMTHYSNIFKSAEEINEEIDEIQEVLFLYDTDNTEEFDRQINQIDDPDTMRVLTKALHNARELYNQIRASGNYEMLQHLDFQKLVILSRNASNRLALLNQTQAIENDSSQLLNTALEDVWFAFTKVNEEEMLLADELKNVLQKTREALADNFDQADPEFVSLMDELKRLFKQKNLHEVSKEEMQANMAALRRVYDAARELERKNRLIQARFDNDQKYLRLYKRLREQEMLNVKDFKLMEALKTLKGAVDQKVLQNQQMLGNESFAEQAMLSLVAKQLKGIGADATTLKKVNTLLATEYFNEFNGRI